jgi:hypothetical protein
LRAVEIVHVNLSRELIDAFLETASRIPLRVHLVENLYPLGTGEMHANPLRISHLNRVDCVPGPYEINFYRPLFRASATTLTELQSKLGWHGCKELAGIDLPLLHSLTLYTLLYAETSATAFLSVQKTIRKLELRGRCGRLPAVPPSALPHLRELNAPDEQVKQLVPGRPVETVTIFISHEADQDQFGEELAWSTAQVRTLRVKLGAIISPRMVERMVTILPSLENLWFFVPKIVSGPLALLR